MEGGRVRMRWVRESVNVSRIVELPGHLYYNGTGTLMGCIIL